MYEINTHFLGLCIKWVYICIVSYIYSHLKYRSMKELEFSDYYKKNFPALQSFAQKLTRNKMDADDLVQETAIKAYRNFDRFSKDLSFKNWTFTILKNTFITKYNKKKRKGEFAVEPGKLSYLPIINAAVEDNSKKWDGLKKAKAHIQKLSQKSKLPLQMYINGYQYNEIAQELDIPIGTVKSRISFARTKLKEAMAA